MTRSFVGILVASLVAVTPRGADAELCRTRRGALVARDTCKRKEAALDLAAVGAAGPKGDRGPRSSGSHPRLRALDAAGTPLPGYLTGAGDVVMPHGSRALRIGVGADGFESVDFLLFEAMDCAGERLVADPGTLVLSVPVVGTTAYSAGDPLQVRAFQSRSFPEAAQSCTAGGGTYDVATGFCCRNVPGALRAGPATPIDLGAFTPPFRVEIER